MKSSIIYLAIVSFLFLGNAIKPHYDKPNIVLIIADDLGYNDLGCYSNKYYETPCLDSLAQSGIKFTNGYSTCPVCSPSRASLLTGKYPARIKLTNFLVGKKMDSLSPVLPAEYLDQLPISEVTVAEELKAAGYTTGIMGKWHLGENTSLGKSDPSFQGFDESIGFDYELLPKGKSFEWYKIGDTTKGYKLYDLTEDITNNSIRFIEKNKKVPFLLIVSHYAVHVPLQAKDGTVQKYLQKQKAQEGYNAQYASMLEQMDAGVGAVARTLKRHGLDKNTIVIFVSDNGGLVTKEGGIQPTTNYPLRDGKGTLYEGGIKIPFLVSGYQIPRGKENNSLVNLMDLFPSLLKIGKSNFKNNGAIDGLDITSCFFQNKNNPSREMFWHYPHFSNQGGRPSAALRKDNYKLIKSLENEAFQLFDLDLDPMEQNNIASTHPSVVKEMNGRIVQWQKSVSANMPIKNPYYKTKSK